MKKAVWVILCLGLVGCATVSIDSVIDKYRTEAPKVKLGDTKENVLSILLPTQEGLSSQSSKSFESYIQDGKVIEIYYMRSGRQPDGLTTDDEFTPYVFTDGALTGIGWTVLGGAKTQGQVVQPAPYVTQQTTVIN
jgi:hypothetical protein